MDAGVDLPVVVVAVVAVVVVEWEVPRWVEGEGCH